MGNRETFPVILFFALFFGFVLSLLASTLIAPQKRQKALIDAPKSSGLVVVEQVVYMVRELRDAYPGKDVKVKVGDVVVVASEPSLGNRFCSASYSASSARPQSFCHEKVAGTTIVAV